MIDWLILMGVGKVMIYLWQQFPLPAALEKFKTIEKLHRCDLCAGVHIYALMAWLTGTYLFSHYIPLVSEYVTGGVISFLVHLISIGWKEKFTNIVVV